MGSLTGKAAIVTGASRGIGREVASALASQGASVAVNYDRNEEAARELVRRIERDGGNAVAVKADVGKVSDLGALFRETLSRFHRLDILVNSAGVLTNTPVEKVTEADFDMHFRVNVKGTYFACKMAAERMQTGGRIINFSSSVLGRMLPNYSVYAGTKGAVEQFTRQLAAEFSQKQITVNAVAPGPVETEMFMTGKTEAQLEATKRATALGRLGQPGDIAKVVLFLAEEASGWITGQVIRVNGGLV